MRLGSSGIRSCLLTFALCACGEPFDASVERAPLSVGAAVYEVLCNRMAADDLPGDVDGSESRATCRFGEPPPPQASRRWLALHQQRPRIVGALDQALDSGRGDRLETLLAQALPLYDAGVIQAPSRAMADLFERVVGDGATLGALERIGARDGYRPARLALGVLEPLLAYPRLDAILDGALRTLAQGGTARAELEQLLQAGQFALDDWQPSASASPTTLQLIRDLLWRADPDLDDGAARYVALRDRRGFVQVDDRVGGMPQPFSDADADGLADVNAAGLFVDGAGRELHPAPPFALPWQQAPERRDVHGRLLRDDGALVYRYLDVSPTLLAASIRAGRELLASRPTGLMDVLVPAVRLLGDPVARSHVYPSGRTWQYQGFAVEQSPLVDLVWALGQLAERDSARRGVELARQLLQRDEAALAVLSDLFVDVNRWGTEAAFADARLEAGATFADDMYELMVETARVPGLLEDIFAAVRLPEVRALGGFYTAYLRHTDRISYDPDDFNGPPIGRPVTPVDRSQPDTDDNRSIFQRLMHLVHDTRGGRLCNKEGAVLDLGIVRYPVVGAYAECELLEIEDMYEFYVRSIIGTARLEFKDPLIDFAADFDLVLEQMSGVDGFTRNPTPEAINRLIFAPMNAFTAALVDSPRTVDGAVFPQRHPGTIFAFEMPGMFEGMAPIIRAFEKHGRLDLFGKMMSAQHLHWASPENDTTQALDPNATAFAHKSGVVRFEELVARTLDRGRLLERLGRLADAVAGIEIEGISGDKIATDLLRDAMLPERHIGLLSPAGQAATPMRIALDALGDIDTRLHADAMETDRLDGAINRLLEQLLRAQGSVGSETFANRTTVALLGGGLDLLAGRLDAHGLAGDLGPWGASLADRLVEAIDEPAVQSGARLLAAVAADSVLRAELDRLLAYLTDGGESPAFDAVVVAAADLLQLLEDDETMVPIFETLAPELDPESGLLVSGEALLRQLHALDSQGALVDLVAALVEKREGGRGETVGEALAHAAIQVNRAEAGRPGALRRDDYTELLTRLGDFLTDETSGLERLYALIANR